jgi:hypothetical protein
MLAVFVLALTLIVTAPPSSDAPGPAAPDRDSTFAERAQAYYASQNESALRDLLDEADTRLERFLARYRLYPLTEDASVIDDVPKDIGANATARELALLSGLWAYRAGEANIFSAIRYGRRSMNRLEEAKQRNPEDPYVLLVEGQSLMFRPDVAGKDVEAAIDRFRTLVDVAEAHPTAGISRTEAQSWLWLALREANHTSEASSLHDAILADAPPELYRKFLEDPPSV